MTYQFTNAWFEQQKPVIESIFSKYINMDNPIKILEIGAFEGRSTTFYLDNKLKHNDSTIEVIDPWALGDSTCRLNSETEKLFLKNIQLNSNKHKLTILKGFSQDILPKLIVENKKYDFIVIDGSHLACDVLRDSVLSFDLLNKGGILFFDDYLWGKLNNLTELGSPQIAIDNFVACYANKLEVIHKDYHFAIKKK